MNSTSTAAYGAPAISVYDIKLIGDSPNQVLFSRGKRISFDSPQLGGVAHVDAGGGLIVYKGGVNEVTDPSFEGSGWDLGPGAFIDASVDRFGRNSLRIDGNGSNHVVAR